MQSPSPMRRVNTAVSRSISPVSISRVGMPQQQVIGNVMAPPGMKTILKPKYYEAVEVPYSIYQSIPQQGQQGQQDLLKKIQQLEQQVSHYKRQTECQTSDDSLQRLQIKIHEQQSEIDRLSRIHSSDQSTRILEEQCQQYFNRFQQSELEKNELCQQLKVNEQHLSKLQQISQQVNDKENRYIQVTREVEMWKQKYSELDNERVSQINDLREEYEKIYNQHYSGLKSNAETKCKQLEETIRRNQIQLDNAIAEAEEWRSRFHKEDMDKLGYNSKISELELQTLHQQKEIDRLIQTNVQKQQDNDALKQRVNQLEFSHVQITQAGLESEVRRLKEQLESRQKEIDDLKRRNQELEHSLLRVKEKSVELELLRAKFINVETQLQESERYKNLHNNGQIEMDEQKGKIYRLEQQVNDSRRNEHRLQGEIQRINDILRVKDEEISRQSIEYKRNMQQMQSQFGQLKQRYEKDLSNVHQIQHRQDYETQENNEQQQQIQYEEMEQLRKERETLLQAVGQLQQTKLQLENKIVILAGEIERLNQVIKTTADEQNHYKESMMILNDQIEQLKSQNDVYRKEIERTRPNSKIYSSGSQKKFDFTSHQDSNWN